MQCEKNGVTRVTFFNVNGDGNWAKWTLKFLYAVNNSSSAPAELIARSIAVIKLIARNIAVIWMQWRMQHSVLQGIMTNPPQNFIEIDFWKPSAPPPEKIHSPLFTHYPPKNSKSAGTPFLLTLKIFQPPPHLQKGGKGGGHYESYESSNVPLNFTLYCKIH